MLIYNLLHDARMEFKSRLEQEQHKSLEIREIVSDLSKKYDSLYKESIHNLFAYEELYSDKPAL